jgi:mono/diheme cytochrome c family protein
MRRLGGCIAIALAAGLPACGGRHSSAGFSLPQGDPARGKEAFVALKCHQCHTVDGVPDLPSPTAEPRVPVTLGGRVPHVKTDGELVASIIDPSHRIAPTLHPELVSRDGKSRMPDYAEVMTVRQLADLVAFLQERYRVVRPGQP